MTKELVRIRDMFAKHNEDFNGMKEAFEHQKKITQKLNKQLEKLEGNSKKSIELRNLLEN